MKTLIAFLAVVMFACTTVETTPNGKQGATTTSQTSKPQPTASATRTATQDNSPRLIIPAKGGAPVMGIPVGGGLYLPVKGGTPIVGIPVTK